MKKIFNSSSMFLKSDLSLVQYFLRQVTNIVGNWKMTRIIFRAIFLLMPCNLWRSQDWWHMQRATKLSTSIFISRRGLSNQILDDALLTTVLKWMWLFHLITFRNTIYSSLLLIFPMSIMSVVFPFKGYILKNFLWLHVKAEKRTWQAGGNNLRWRLYSEGIHFRYMTATSPGLWYAFFISMACGHLPWGGLERSLDIVTQSLEQREQPLGYSISPSDARCRSW